MVARLMGRSIRAAKVVRRIGELVHLCQESFGEFVRLALAHLICVHRDVHVMSAFGTYADTNRSNRSTVPASPLFTFVRLEIRAKMPICLRQNLLGRQRSTMEISHAVTSLVLG